MTHSSTEDPVLPVIAGVDPRMRERWVVARREEGRRRLRLVIAVVGVASLLGIAYLVANSPLLGADTIRVRGTSRIPAGAVRAAARISDGAPLLFLDHGAIERRVEALPDVRRARVTTELPNTVVIFVTERVPVAWMHTAEPGTIAVVDADGRVLRRVPTPPALVPEVVGAGLATVPGHTVASPGAFRALGALPAALRVRVLTFKVSAGHGTLTIGGAPPDAGAIRLGAITDMRRKGEVALGVLADLASRQQRVAWLDVSVPGAPFTG